MKIGFGRSDITPRVGVELCGFGPYINRHSVGVRDHLWARAMACEHDGVRWVLVSCDLVGVDLSITQRVRALVREASGINPDAVMVHCTHTHSGPATTSYIGWGAPDEPYIQTLPRRIAGAVTDAIANLQDATLFHGRAPCEGIGYNREYDETGRSLDEVLTPGWRPDKPELADTVCHVFKAVGRQGVIGFMSYFGCHPVVCCADTRWIHGDYCGVATNLLEKEYPGATGMFLQGAEGDVNSCVVHQYENASLRALEVIAGRYAACVRAALAAAQPFAVDSLAFVRRDINFSRKSWDLAKLREMLANEERIVQQEATDDNYKSDDYPNSVRLHTVYMMGLRHLVERGERGLPFEPVTEVQGLRLGTALFVGSPMETFQAIKRDVCAASGFPLTYVMSFCNDSGGYATDHAVAARGGYAADMVPLILGVRPFACIHDELVQALSGLALELEKPCNH